MRVAKTVKIVFQGGGMIAPDARGAKFTVERPESRAAGSPIHAIEFTLTGDCAQLAVHRAGLKWSDETNAAVGEAMIQQCLRRLEAGLRTDSWDRSNVVQGVRLDDNDAEHIAKFLQRKSCKYQAREDGSLFCTASHNKDQDLMGTQGIRRVAPTTQAHCHQCEMPPADVLCSLLTHPKVSLRHTSAGYGRHVDSADCEEGRAGVRSQPFHCRAGGHECWRRLIVIDDLPTIEPAPPRALPDALDQLDTAWRLAFRNDGRLYRPQGAADAAILAAACVTEADVRAAVSAIDDAIKSFQVADERIPEADRGSADLQGGRTINRLEAALRHALGADSDDPAGATRTLRRINRVRVAMQHSGARAELLPALEDLGVESPPDWPAAWEILRARTVQSLHELRRLAKMIADRE